MNKYLNLPCWHRSCMRMHMEEENILKVKTPYIFKFKLFL